MSRGYTKEAGYKNTMHERVASWLGSSPEFLAFMEARLEAQSPHGWVKSTGAEAAGAAFLGIAPTDSWGSNPDPEVHVAIQKIVESDAFLEHEGFRFSWYDRPVRVAFGKAVQASEWWTRNAKEIRKSIKTLKEVEAVQEA